MPSGPDRRLPTRRRLAPTSASLRGHPTGWPLSTIPSYFVPPSDLRPQGRSVQEERTTASHPMTRDTHSQALTLPHTTQFLAIQVLTVSGPVLRSEPSLFRVRLDSLIRGSVLSACSYTKRHSGNQHQALWKGKPKRSPLSYSRCASSTTLPAEGRSAPPATPSPVILFGGGNAPPPIFPIFSAAHDFGTR